VSRIPRRCKCGICCGCSRYVGSIEDDSTCQSRRGALGKLYPRLYFRPSDAHSQYLSTQREQMAAISASGRILVSPRLSTSHTLCAHHRAIGGSFADSLWLSGLYCSAALRGSTRQLHCTGEVADKLRLRRSDSGVAWWYSSENLTTYTHPSAYVHTRQQYCCYFSAPLLRSLYIPPTLAAWPAPTPHHAH
jgi:hypothetical protein